MDKNYALFSDMAAEMTVPEDGTLSRTLYQDDRVKVVLFGFSAGQELSEHTAAVPAILQILRGQARIGLGGDTVEACEGAWIHMEPNLTHSVVAETPVVMLLTLLRTPS